MQVFIKAPTYIMPSSDIGRGLVRDGLHWRCANGPGRKAKDLGGEGFKALMFELDTIEPYTNRSSN